MRRADQWYSSHIVWVGLWSRRFVSSYSLYRRLGKMIHGYQALILAHERSNYYGHLLRHVRALVFLGVPHRGADAAYWVNFAARLLQFGQLGFGTNPAYVSAFQRNSTTFTNIS